MMMIESVATITVTMYAAYRGWNSPYWTRRPVLPKALFWTTRGLKESAASKSPKATKNWYHLLRGNPEAGNADTNVTIDITRTGATINAARTEARFESSRL